MQKKAIILDLDNTIYPVQSIADELFKDIFEVIHQDGSHEDEFEQIKEEIQRRPFQWVASHFHFSNKLIEKGLNLLKQAEYKGKIEPFSDYYFTHSLLPDKFLVTAGFFKLQQTKIEGMQIAKDFKEIFIIDSLTSDKTKKDVFAEIIKKYNYQPLEVVVIGDDIESEIKAAQELGMMPVLYDKFNKHTDHTTVKRISDFEQLVKFI